MTNPSDTLIISDLSVWTHIGVPSVERATEQQLLVTVEMSLDTKAAAKSDDVKKSINYFNVAEDIKTLAKTERKTIERFAEEVAKMILKKHKTSSATVTVIKFPPIGAASVCLTVTRKR